jgi:hypothetical protein
MNVSHEIERGDCLHLLAQKGIGQVAFTARALPTIRSLSYALLEDDVVVDTQSENLAERLDGQVVAFAVEEASAGHERGWSVIVTGQAKRLLGDADLRLPVFFADGPAPHPLVRISPGLITGRWVSAPQV